MARRVMVRVAAAALAPRGERRRAQLVLHAGDRGAGGEAAGVLVAGAGGDDEGELVDLGEHGAGEHLAGERRIDRRLQARSP